MQKERPTADHGILKSISLLYVEDNDDIREQLGQFLRRRVGTFHTAADGQEGLDKFLEHRPDVVVTDILMPVMDGLKMAEAIKAESPDTPVIVTTAFNEQDYLIRSIDIGIDKYVLKPVNTDILIRAVHRVSLGLLQKREIDARNDLVHFLLDMHPNFVVIYGQDGLEYINRTFLGFLGHGSMAPFLAGEARLDDFIVQIDGDPYPRADGMAWTACVTARSGAENVLYLRDPATGNLRAYMVTFNHFPELDKVIFSFTDVTHIEWEKASLERQAMTDALTGIFNREKFDEAIQMEMERARRYGTPLSLIMFDIDHFKHVNDAYGHPVGDMVLVQLSALVSAHIRETDLFARWGGEEFMILAPGTDGEQARQMAEKLREKVADNHFDVVDHLTASFGVTQFQADENARTLTRRVDDALYRAKHGGRNRVEKV